MSKQSDQGTTFWDLLKQILSIKNLRRVLLVGLIILVIIGIYGFFEHKNKGTEVSIIFGLIKLGVDYRNFGIIDATCDSRVKEAISLITPSIIEVTPSDFISEVSPDVVSEYTKEATKQPSPTHTPVPFTPPWNFNDGCIWSEWTYWVPDYHSYNVADTECLSSYIDEAYPGFDLSYFGMDAVEDEGLTIYKYKYPPNNTEYKVGLSRLVPDDSKEFQIEFNWSVLEANHVGHEIMFSIGFIDSKIGRDQGSFIDFYNKYGKEGEIFQRDDHFLLRRDGSPSENQISFCSARYKRKISIVCDISGDIYADCTFYIDENDNKTTQKRIHFPDSWDSIYIGYELPHEGSIDLQITNLIISKGN
jgi:hypothetical protein